MCNVLVMFGVCGVFVLMVDGVVWYYLVLVV